MTPAYEPGANLNIDFLDASGKNVGSYKFNLDQNRTPQPAE